MGEGGRGREGEGRRNGGRGREEGRKWSSKGRKGRGTGICTCTVHIVQMYMCRYMSDQPLRPGKAKQLCLKTALFFMHV